MREHAQFSYNNYQYDVHVRSPLLLRLLLTISPMQCRYENDLLLTQTGLYDNDQLQCDQIWQFFGLWAIFLKSLATINLPKSSTFFGNFCKDVNIIYFSSEIIFGQLLQTFGHFFLVTLNLAAAWIEQSLCAICCLPSSRIVLLTWRRGTLPSLHHYDVKTCIHQGTKLCTFYLVANALIQKGRIRIVEVGGHVRLPLDHHNGPPRHKISL